MLFEVKQKMIDYEKVVSYFVANLTAKYFKSQSGTDILKSDCFKNGITNLMFKYEFNSMTISLHELAKKIMIIFGDDAWLVLEFLEFLPPFYIKQLSKYGGGYFDKNSKSIKNDIGKLINNEIVQQHYLKSLTDYLETAKILDNDD